MTERAVVGPGSSGSGLFSRARESILTYAASAAAASAIKMAGKLDREYGEDVGVVMARGGEGGTLSDYSNFDDLIQRRGLNIYSDMLKDAEVRNAVNGKKFGVISADWAVLPVTEKQIDRDVAAFCQYSLERMRGSVVRAVWGLMDALAYGYAIAELTLEPIGSGDHAGKWGLKWLKSKDPRYYEFGLDDYGNMEKLFLKPLEAEKTEIPVEKFVLYTYQPEYERPYGRSDLRSVYKHWFSKDFLMKMQNVYLERFGMPLRIGRYPISMAAKRNDLLKILQDMVSDTAAVIPEDLIVEFIEAAGRGEVGFKNAIAYHDKQIVKGILGQTLTSGTGDKAGSYALGNIHAETKEDYVTFLRRDLAETVIREQILRLLVKYNYGEGVEVPRFEWQPRKGRLMVANMDDLFKLVSTKMLTNSDANILRERMGLPWLRELDNNEPFVSVGKAIGGDEEEDAGQIDGGALPVPEPDGPAAAGTAGLEGAPDTKTEDSEPAPGTEAAPADGSGQHAQNNKLDYARTPVRELNAASMYSCERRLGGVSWYKKQIAERDEAEAGFIADVRPDFEAMRDAMKNQTRKLIRDGGDIDKLKIPAGPMAGLRHKAVDFFNNVTTEGYLVGLKEVDQPTEVIPESKYSAYEIDYESLVWEYALSIGLEAQPPEAALAQVGAWKASGDWAKIRKARGALMGKIVARQTRRTKFWVTDVVDTELLTGVKKAIFGGMEAGLGEAQIVGQVGQVFESYIARGEAVEAGLLKASRLENIVRTNTTRALAQAQKLAYQDPAVIDDFPGIMPSGIADSRQTDFCASVDGQIYPANEPTPYDFPAHCECRSRWVPVPYNDPDFEKQGFGDPPDMRLVTKEFGGLK